MAQNVYDNEEFFTGYIQLPRQQEGLHGGRDWPHTRALLPDLKGKRVVDLGCGIGHFCRYARNEGAATVLGVDISENMISRAKASNSDIAVDYRILDLESLDLPEASFDFVYSALVFHYVENFAGLVRAVYDALIPGSYFVFEIEHPVFTATRKGEWIQEEERWSWPVDRYSTEGERIKDWFNTVSLPITKPCACHSEMLT